VNKNRIIVPAKFKQSLAHITANVSKQRSNQLAEAIDNLKKMLISFPESFPIIDFEIHVEIPFRKAVIAKDFIVIYLYQHEKIYFINIFHTAQNWKRKLIH